MAAPRYNTLSGGQQQNVAAATTATANAIVATGAGGTLDPSLMPAGIGQDIVTATASEALAAGALVSLYTNSGALGVRNADNSSANGGKRVSGFVLAAVSSGGTASVYRSGMNTSVTGLTPGTDYYLGTTGGLTATPPTTSGTTSQYVGTALSATAIDVQPQPPVGIN